MSPASVRGRAAFEAGHPRRWLILVVLCTSLLVIGLDNTILNVALPTISNQLGATSAQLQWLVDSYTLVFAGLLLVGGSLGDRFGRKGALAAGLVIFGIGSALSAFAPSPAAVVATRALMGVGAALVMPTTLSIITNVFPAAERPKAIAVWAGISALGIAVGPVAGGFLIERFWWGAVFLVNVPVVAVALAAGRALVPTSRDPVRRPLDVVGAALSVLGLATVVYAVIEAPRWGWTHPTTLAVAAAGLGLLTVFVVWECRCSHPMLDVTVFGDRRFSGASAAVTLVFFALLGSLFLNTQYLQTVLGYGPLQAGLAVTPIALSMVGASQVGVRLAARFGARRVVSAGFLLVAVSMVLMAGAGVDSGYAHVLAGMVLLGSGMGTAMSPATESIMSTLPREKSGAGSAVNDTTRQIGGALGVAVLGSLFASGYAAAVAPAAAGLPEAAGLVVQDSVTGALAVAQRLGGLEGESVALAAKLAFVEAKAVALLVGAAVAALGSLTAYLLIPHGTAPAPECTPTAGEGGVAVRAAAARP